MQQKFKIAIIGDDKIELFGDPKGEKRHSEYLCEYIKTNFSNVKAFQHLSDRTIPEQLANLLVYLGNKTVVLNETRVDNNGKVKYGSMACVILPSQISNEMLDNLLSVDFESFSDVIVERVQLSSDRILEDNITFDFEDLKIHDRLIALASQINDENRRFER